MRRLLTEALEKLEREQLRFDVLWRSLPFSERCRYGGDEAEAREGVDWLIAQKTWEDA